jgi:hypothetical protein
LGRSARQCIRLFQKSYPNPRCWTSHIDRFCQQLNIKIKKLTLFNTLSPPGQDPQAGGDPFWPSYFPRGFTYPSRPVQAPPTASTAATTASSASQTLSDLAAAASDQLMAENFAAAAEEVSAAADAAEAAAEAAEAAATLPASNGLRRMSEDPLLSDHPYGVPTGGTRPPPFGTGGTAYSEQQMLRENDVWFLRPSRSGPNQDEAAQGQGQDRAEERRERRRQYLNAMTMRFSHSPQSSFVEVSRDHEYMEATARPATEMYTNPERTTGTGANDRFQVGCSFFGFFFFEFFNKWL